MSRGTCLKSLSPLGKSSASLRKGWGGKHLVTNGMTPLLPNDQIKFRLDRIYKIKDYFEFEIRETEAVIKIMSKYTAALDYADKTLIVLSATNREISIISFTNVIGIPAGVISESLTLVFSLTTEIIKKLLK